MKFHSFKRQKQKRTNTSGKASAKPGSPFFAQVQSFEPVKTSFESAIHTLGQNLPNETKKFFEPKLGASFSNVKIHTGTKAAKASEALNAKAFTYGNNIFFNKNEYQPHTIEGKLLLAHELVHVLHGNHQAIMRKKKPNPDKKDAPKKEPDIKIEKGDKDWSTQELELLHSAISGFSDEEINALRGYRFVRWSNKAERIEIDKTYKDPGGTEECGLHEIDLKKNIFRISLYDDCFSDPEAIKDEKFGIDKGRFHILHEIGHAMQSAELRSNLEVFEAANKKYNEAVDKYNVASPVEQNKMKTNVKRLSEAETAAKTIMDNSKGRNVTELGEMMKGKDAMTEYAATSNPEAFAEAFAIYKADPVWLKENYPAVFEWFSKGGFLKPVKKKGTK